MGASAQPTSPAAPRAPRRSLAGAKRTDCGLAEQTAGLFGLGFDTATEIGLLALAAGVATHRVPLVAILALPTLFAAGMSLLDTADGVFMSHAYGWAFSNPVRKLYYNITVTSLSVAVALVIGMIELLQVTVGPGILDLSKVGYLVVALFFATWAFSLVYRKARRVEERWTG